MDKDPSDIIIIIRRTQNGTEVCESAPISVHDYTALVGAIPTPVSTPLAGAYTQMNSVI